MSSKLMVLISASLLLAVATGLQAVTLTVGPDADTYVIDESPHGDAAYLYIHDTADAVIYMRFDLAALNVMTVQDATLTMTVSGGAPRNDKLVDGRFWLHGLDNVPGNTPQDWDEATLTTANIGAEYGDPLVNTTDLDGAIAGVTETITNTAGLDYWDAGSTTVTVTGETFVAFLQSRVDDTGLITLLVDFPGSTGRGLGLASKEFETVEFRPTLVLEATVGAKTAAVAPSPQDGATDVLRDTVLSWEPGAFAATHDVYFSTSLEEVETASAGALVAQGADTTYAPPGHLAFGQTYYWRIDEVNGAPDFTVYDGSVWSFTVEPVAYPLANVTATASTTSDEDKGPENTVNGSGLSEDRLHSDSEDDMWQGDAVAGDPVWIQFEFDRPYKLHEMQVWNYNFEYEFILNFGVKEITIEYATDANEWATLGDFEIAQAPGTPDYAGQTLDLNGVAAKYVRMNILGNHGTSDTYALSEVSFSYIPVTAREPMPAPGTTVDPAVVLDWRSGREAASHQIYLGTDQNAVADDTALLETTGASTYDAGVLDLGTTYYWKITEVNEAETPTAWASDIWNFSTPEFIVVDDFESYTDELGSRIYEAWADGYNVAGNGSQVGHDDPPYAEQTTVYSGDQSMPFYYGREGVTVSEATLTLDGAQDWTRAGAQTLVLHVHGKLGNAAGQLYLRVNNMPVNFTGSAESLAAPLWKQWNVDLASLGNTAKNVSSLTIGVSGSGAGLLYIDDIRLYRTPPASAEPAVDPGTANLVALYAMESNVNDGSGNSLNGTAEVGSSFEEGLAGYGKALVLDGVSAYADLPIGSLMQSLNSITVATWVNWDGTATLGRILDFGTGTTANMWMAPNAYGGLVCAITADGYQNESRVVAPSALPTGWHHVAVTIDGATSEMNLYLDGSVADTETTGTLPGDLGATTQNWIGRSQYEADPYFGGSIDDFRIYDRVLSQGEVRYIVGDR